MYNNNNNNNNNSNINNYSNNNNNNGKIPSRFPVVLGNNKPTISESTDELRLPIC